MSWRRPGLIRYTAGVNTGAKVQDARGDTVQVAIEHASEVLASGGLVAYPTETYYGIAARADNALALERLAELKGRDRKPLPLIAASVESVRDNATVPKALAPLLMLWPAPLTLALPPRRALPRKLCGAGTTLGIRVPASALARQVALAGGSLVTSTSANLAGLPPACAVAELDERLVANVDLVLDGGTTMGGLPSTVVAEEAGRAVLLRKGAVSAEQLRTVLGYLPELRL